MEILIQENYSLALFNTFKIECNAKYFSRFNSIKQLRSLTDIFHSHELMILGGGSNVLFTKDFNGVILKNEIVGLEVINESKDYIFLKVGAGENWSAFVDYCVKNNYGGVENLSLIPGNVGSAPIQNIGAYGVELQNVFHELDAYDLAENNLTCFNNSACEFGYRNSVFKNKYKGRYVILNVTFKLLKKPFLNTSYGAIEEQLNKMNITSAEIKDVAQAVINIRKSKLPDPAIIGNAGSFFKNPEINEAQFLNILAKYPDVPTYRLSNGNYKIPAAWLIEQMGWKGYRLGDAGCHILQPLVLVNYGEATGKEIIDLANKIVNSVLNEFNISLEMEVNII